MVLLEEVCHWDSEVAKAYARPRHILFAVDADVESQLLQHHACWVLPQSRHGSGLTSEILTKLHLNTFFYKSCFGRCVSSQQYQ